MCGAGRGLLEAEHEPRARENGLERHADSGFEVPAFTAVVEEFHQRLDVAARRRLAVRLGGEALDDLRRARRFVARRRRPAREDLAAARRVGHAGDPERTRDAEVAQVRQHRDPERAADFGVGQRVVDRRHEIVDRTVGVLDERRADVLRAGVDMKARRGEVQTRLGLLRHPVIDVEERCALAVDRDFDLLVAHVAAEEFPGRHAVQHDAERVVAVGGERVEHGEAAARTPGRSFDVRHLRLRARNLIRRFARAGVAIADREAGDSARRAQVAVEHRGREQLHVRNVVEPRADGVGRQERVHVDVEREQIANRTRVLGAIQALERAASRVRTRRRGGVDPVFERGEEGLDGRGIGPVLHAGRRHHAEPQLVDHLLRRLNVLIDARRVEVLERQPAGLRVIVVTSRAVVTDELVLRLGRHRFRRMRRRHRGLPLRRVRRRRGRRRAHRDTKKR